MKPNNKHINIVGARQNNLKNISLEIPKDEITVFTGVSGSGKSSLVFKTIGAEAQRQINETQNSFTRNRLNHYGVPDVDKIEHLNVPVIISQKRLGGNARSTVGTATDIYTSLRLLFSRIGQPFVGYSGVFSFNHPQGMCPACEGLGFVSKINTKELLDENKSLNEGAILFPTFQPGGYRWLRYVNSGYFDADKKLRDFSKTEWDLLLNADEHMPTHPNSSWGKTMRYIGLLPRIENDFLKRDSKEHNIRKKELQKIVVSTTCPDCLGKRLNENVLSCKIHGKDIADCAMLPIDELLKFIKTISSKPFNSLLEELKMKLNNVVDIGLQYLTLDRSTSSLSGGESQRIKMVRHLGNSLENLLYIFDEPSIGLHPKDLDNISSIINKIRNKGNTVLIVEHDPDIIKIADHIVDIGPGAGVDGGQIVYQGSFNDLKTSGSRTGAYFSQKRSHKISPRKAVETIKIKDATMYNLKELSVDIPLNVLSVVTGVAGSGKSTLIRKVLPSQFPEVRIIDQSPIIGSSRGTLLTYLGIFDKIRKVFAQANKVSTQLFSNNSLGACSNCKGLGFEKIDLAFMDDVELPCEVCNGSGFTPEVLKYKFQRKNITEIMELTIEEALTFFRELEFVDNFRLLTELGLGYLKLGQRLNTFSGGERQRLKLSAELEVRNHIIVLDEPSIGLHPSDTQMLLDILERLVEMGNTVIVIEHNLDIISQADWIIDIGPGAGKCGGQLIFQGTVDSLLGYKNSETANYLKSYLNV
ncbi:excinuclease ABC subunit UvrA [Paradesertivirga mongoliensis]|uniref:UvrABC system protein A n=1 Tax=Paradesertivirga mongoliensis TaxID=2100740 RepID=A0ABW4ZRJ2_9SPHI